jgi:hypothetical protein
MNRYKRPPFVLNDLNTLPRDEARNRLLFDWWCDEGELKQACGPSRKSDRLSYIDSLGGEPTPFPSRSLRQNDPAPPLNERAPQGFRLAFLLSKPEHIRKALTDTENFCNLPYAALGGASFLLGLEPGQGYNDIDWHSQQQGLVSEALDYYKPAGLGVLAKLAVDQAALTSLARPAFDLAEFAEQAALRYAGQLFGYGFQDHGLLEEASRTTYRALQYLTVGQHFVTEPGTLPAAQNALGRLTARTSQLMEDYTRLERSPRRYGRKQSAKWPEGVQPWGDLGLSALGEPLLKRLPNLPKPASSASTSAPGELLSGRDRAIVAATLVAGTLGNIQSAVCLLMQSLLCGPADELNSVSDLAKSVNPCMTEQLEKDLLRRLAKLPPVPVLPRRTRDAEVTLACGARIPADTDCLLLLEGQPGCPHAHTAEPCPRVWGGVGTLGEAPHACLGQALSMSLIMALVSHTLRLPGLKLALDPLTGDTLQVERLWGFACTRYPLRFERERYRAQQNLIVSMRVKAPISENAMRLRRLIAAGVPRIDHALTGFGHVHLAWFEFSDDDSQLVLRTIYDGQFEAYVEHFALQVGDLFDGLFEYLEGAPPRPVAEHPQEFVEALRLNNRAPLAGYLFSAYPHSAAEQILRNERSR